jgi:hypothetical protein
MEPWVEPWSPGIGDPTVMGWLTVFAYFGAAIACGVAHRRRRASEHAWVWPGLLVLLVLLGINKQLDLQSWFTYVGKRTAIEQGWYADRRPVQVAFIVTLATVGVVCGAVLLHRLRGALARFRWALVGTVFLISFIVVRAASFHHVDIFLKLEIAGIQPNWILELGGIALIGFAALRESGYIRNSRQPARARRSPRKRKRAEDMGWLDILIELWHRGQSKRSETSVGPRAPGAPKKKAPRVAPASRRPTREKSSGSGRGFRVVMAGPPRRKNQRR